MKKLSIALLTFASVLNFVGCGKTDPVQQTQPQVIYQQPTQPIYQQVPVNQTLQNPFTQQAPQFTALTTAMDTMVGVYNGTIKGSTSKMTLAKSTNSMTGQSGFDITIDSTLAAMSIPNHSMTVKYYQWDMAGKVVFDLVSASTFRYNNEDAYLTMRVSQAGVISNIRMFKSAVFTFCWTNCTNQLNDVTFTDFKK